MKKRLLFFTLVVTMLVVLVGCGNKSIDETTTTDVQNTTDGQESEPSADQLAHDHIFSYVSNMDGTHNETCSICDYVEIITCTLNENYICNVCEWSHEHTLVATPDEQSTHTFACAYDCCDYSYVNDCEYSNLICTVCGGIYPWESDINYFSDAEIGTYYAQKELNVYICPNTNSEIIKTLSVDEGVHCVGFVFYDYGSTYERFLVTEDGYCVPSKFNSSTSK